MEMIIPADEHSGGAHAAEVAFFADRLISTGSDTGRTEWRDGLRLLNDEAAKSSLAKALASAAQGEANPQTGLERFFVTLKQMTATGYYSSEIGIHQDLQYQGNTYVAEFPGCPDDSDIDACAFDARLPSLSILSPLFRTENPFHS